MISTPNSFVVFPLGEKRFGLPADMVNEMACPDRVQSFPNTTPLLSGVLVRRGRIVPVCDIGAVIGSQAPRQHRLCLIASLPSDSAPEWVAVPVSGDAELINVEMQPPTDAVAPYVAGLLALGEEVVEVIDLRRLISAEVRA